MSLLLVIEQKSNHKSHSPMQKITLLHRGNFYWESGVE